MQEVTKLVDGSLKAEFDGKELTIYLNDYNSRSFKSMNEAISALGSLLGMVTKAVSLRKQRVTEPPKNNKCNQIIYNDMLF